MDVRVLACIPPSDALHNCIKSVFSQNRWGVLGITKDAVGCAPDGLFEFPQLLQWGTVPQPIGPAGPQPLQLWAEGGVSKGARRDRNTVAFTIDLGWTGLAVKVQRAVVAEVEMMMTTDGQRR